MTRVLHASTLILALALAAGVSAQAPAKTKAPIKPEDAKVLTLRGCLESGVAHTFTLSYSLPEGAETPAEHPPTGVIGTSGTKTGYVLMPQAGVNLAPHVGHQVEITALAIKSEPLRPNPKPDAAKSTA